MDEAMVFQYWSSWYRMYNPCLYFYIVWILQPIEKMISKSDSTNGKSVCCLLSVKKLGQVEYLNCVNYCALVL